MLKHILLVSLLSFSTLPLLKAQSCGNDEKYHLPYKNTYVKEPLVTENEYRVAKPETIVPKSFEEARQILPNPIWGGHEICSALEMMRNLMIKKMMQQRMMLPMQTQQKKIQLIQRKMLNSQPEQKQL